MNKIPENIKILSDQRQKFRREGNFGQADEIRRKIEELGFIIKDYRHKSTVMDKFPELPAKKSLLVIFGSGEISPTAVKIHDYVLRAIGKKKIKIVLISIPAGFQPNVEAVYREISQFFIEHLKNYQPEVKVIMANDFTSANNEKILKPLDDADYIVTGPGSPTYAVKHLKNTLLFGKIRDKVKSGASLCLASAASITFSHLALPVYEIYKVGEPLHWQNGLDFYTEFYKPLTVIPHFNNQDGGDKYDTSRCYMGKIRFKALLKLLPPGEAIYGIDENTAVIINLKNRRLITLGKGKLHRI